MQLRHRYETSIVLAATLALVDCGSKPSSKGVVTIFDIFYDHSATVRLEQATEELIAKCMKDRGWAYKPVVFQVLKTPSLEGTIARYGYGISTNSGRGVPATLRRVSDPNATTVAALSPSERDSYYRDLGRPGGLGPSAAPRVGSCEQSVRLKSPPRFDGVPVTPTLLAQLHGLEGRVRIDPRMRKANLAWAECMNQSGYRYVDKRQAYNDFLNRYQQLSPAQSQTGRALRDLQKAEIRVATLDQSCYRKYILPIEEKVRADVSSTYLAKLRSP